MRIPALLVASRARVRYAPIHYAMAPDVSARLLSPEQPESGPPTTAAARRDMAARVRAFNWSATPLGPMDRWSPSLRAAVDLLLSHPLPMAVLWGPQLIQIYNDGYAAILGARHPAALGQPAREGSPELWHTHGPACERVLGSGGSIVLHDQRFPVERDGSLEDAFFTLTYSPVRDETGAIAGVVLTAVETTEAVRADEARRTGEFRFQRLVEHSPQSTQLFFPDGRTRQINAAFVRLFGITLDQLRDYNIRRDPELVRLGVMPIIERAFAGEAGTIEPIPYVPDRGQYAGQTRWAGAYIYPVKDERGRVEEVVLVHSDVTEQKRAEDELRKFKFITDNANESLLLMDRDARLVYANRFACERLGYAEGGMVGMTIPDLDPLYPLPRYREVFERAQHGSVPPFESVHRRRDGTEFPVEITLTRVEFGGGVYLFASSRDITQRKRAADALRASEERLRFLDALGEATGTADDAFAVMTIAARMLGTHLSATRCAYADVEADGDRFTIRDDWRVAGAATTAGTYRLDQFGRRAVEELRAGRVLVIRDVDAELDASGDPGAATFNAIGIKAIVCCPLVKDGRLRAMMAVHQATPRDWTDAEAALVREVAERSWAHIERVRSEAALRESEERFRLVAEAAPQFVWITDPQGLALYFNQQYYDYMGTSQSETTARQVAATVVHPDDVPATMAAFEVAQRTGGTFQIEHRIRAKDGSYRWFTVRAEPYRDPKTGEIARWYGASTDIHDRRLVEAALRESEERLAFSIEAAELGTFYCPMPLGRIEWNDKCKEHFWLPPDAEVDFERFYAILHPDDRERTRRAVDHAVFHRESYDIEYRTVAPDGRERWVRAKGRAYYDANGEPTRFDGVTLDITDRKRVEEALRDSERRFRQTADAAPAILWITEADGRCSFLSRGWYDLTGQTESEALGYGWANAAHPDDAIAARDAFLAATAARAAYAVDFRVRRADGQYRWVIDAGRPRFGAGGEFLGFVGSVIDITDRKLAEERLRAQSMLTETVTNNAAEALYLLDFEGQVTFANPAAHEMFGWSSEEIVGRKLHEVIHYKHPDGSPFPMSECTIGRCFASGQVLRNHEDVFIRRGGSFVAVQCSMAPIRGDAAISGAVLAVSDITDRKRAEAALRESERRFRELAEAMPQIVWVTRPDGYHEYYNRRWYEFTGLPEGSAHGDGWNAVFHPDDQPVAWERWRHSLATGEPYEIEYRLRHHSGEYIWTLGRALPVRDAAGNITRWYGTCTDVQALKLLEQEREALLLAERSARDEAERAGRMKDEFLATLSHELRTPLNAIYGWSQMLLRSDKMPAATVRQGIETIERNARAQTQIIEDLLDMSRIISGKVHLDVQQVALDRVVEAAVQTVRHAAEAKGVRLHAVLDSQAGPVSGDPNRLQQVLWNLLSNAIKYTHRNGRVQVVLQRVGSQLELSVADTGEGIAPEFLPHVFDRFRQADSTTTRRHGGLGLGLAIVKQLVELHGGTIHAASPGVDMGSTFTVRLPLRPLRSEADVAPNADAPKSPLPTPNTGDGACASLANVRVLVVDDEPDARDLLRQLLEECDAEVATASSAAEAIERLQNHRPDVLVSDIGMPGEDGYALIRRIRTRGPDGQVDVPALALTAYARSEDRVKALEAGFQMHLSKPVEPAELIAVVASLARRGPT